MSIRSALQTAVLAASFALIGCTARPATIDAGTGGGTGTVDSGTVDSGTVVDAGSQDAGTPPPETVAAAKAIKFPGLVNLKGVVVTAVAFASRSNSMGADCKGTNSKGTTAEFWVADPNNAQAGIYVTKFRCDTTVDYMPVVGDVLDLTGYIGIESKFTDREAFRWLVKQQYDFLSPKPRPAAGEAEACTAANSCQPLVITLKSQGAALPDNMVTATFGDNGAIRANPTYAGARVKMAGPVSISNASPAAMRRISLVPGDNRYFGFQLSNGVLVNNYRTYATFAPDGGLLEDGGTSTCDFRLVVLDGGALSFASIAGMWDSYSHAVCADGGVDFGCFKAGGGSVPGTDAGYTYVLYPMNCADFVVQ